LMVAIGAGEATCLAEPTAAGPAGLSRPRSATVVICAHSADRWESILRSVASVQSQASNVIVVVDHNPLLYADLRRTLPASVVIVESTHARGLSGARNTGIDTATDAVVAFVDDDAEVSEGWLQDLVAPYSDPNVVAVGGRIDPVWPRGQRPAWFPRQFDWVVGCTFEGMPTEESDVLSVIGCNMSFRREALVANGGFREALGRRLGSGLGSEETELCLRVLRERPQARIVYRPTAVVRHHVSPQRTSVRYFVGRCVDEGRSKAILRTLVRSESALQRERRYLVRTLIPGIVGELASAVARVDGEPLRRAALIVSGTTIVLAAYVRTTLRLRGRPARPSARGTSR